MKYFILMIQFFTTIPLKTSIEIKEEDFSKGLPYFPLVGLIIGLFNYIIFHISTFINIEFLSVVFWILANIIITGGLHLDGLADTCDGLLSSRNKEKMLEIMKDSRIGTNGVLAIIMDLLIKLGLMISLPANLRPLAIISSVVLGKTIMLVLIYTTPYGRKNGIGGLFYKGISKISVAIGSMIGVIIIIAIHSLKIIPILLLCIVPIAFYRKFVINKIDGITGDTLGAANELAEILFLFYIIVFERVGLL